MRSSGVKERPSADDMISFKSRDDEDDDDDDDDDKRRRQGMKKTIWKGQEEEKEKVEVEEEEEKEIGWVWRRAGEPVSRSICLSVDLPPPANGTQYDPTSRNSKRDVG
jgi:hypothetical protein